MNSQPKIGPHLELSFLILFLLSSFGFGQSPITAPWVKTPQLNVSQPAVPLVASVSASVVGNTGNATYYYWVVPNYNWGQGPVSSPVQVNNAPSVLSAADYVTVSWVPPSTVNESQLPAPQTTVTYDLLRTTTPNFPNTPATIAVATGLTATSYNDQGAALSSYTLNPLPSFESLEITRGKGILEPIMSLPAAQLPFYAQWNSIGFETDGVPGNSVCNGGGSSFVLCRFDQTLNEWVPVFGSGGGCSNGASDTQYVDSRTGNDSNSGLNWCVAKATEQAAVTALSATGGWIYEAPDYTDASATGVPSNIHILRTNQFDSLGSSAQRFSFPSWSDTTQDHFGFYSGTSAVPSDAHTAFVNLGPFGNSNLVSSVVGDVTVPSTASAYPSEQAGVSGIVSNSSTASDIAQSDGVYGACYNPGAATLDCTGVVGVAGNASTGASGAFEAGWFNLSLGFTPTDAMGVVIRATGGHMPTAEIGSQSGRANAAVDVAYGGGSGNSFPSGLYFENQAVANWPIVLGANSITNNPHTNVFTYGILKNYYTGSTPFNTLSVVKINNNPLTNQGAYQNGNLIWTNSANSSEVVLPINSTGTVSVDGINSVAFSATPVFDRSKGTVQAITLTANVTSSTLNNCVAGQTVIFDVIENSTGGFTFTWPASFHGAGTITTTASEHNRQQFYCDASGSVWSVSAMQSGT